MNKKRYLNIGLCLILSISIVTFSIVFKENIIYHEEVVNAVLDIEDEGNVITDTDKKEEKSMKLEDITKKYKDKTPTKWSEKMDGVLSQVQVNDKTIYLTFDACGGDQGNGYDKELIDFLIKEKIPATLFINYRWIMANEDTFKSLAKNDLFEIENHGYSHKPLSVSGKEIYNIKGTANIEEVYNEIELNSKKIEELTGRRPIFFRSGTAYYDDVAVNIAKDLGQIVTGFTIAADGGATFTKDQILKVCEEPKNGSILLFHMNQPSKQTYEGIKELLPKLKAKGYKFGKLEDTLK